MVKSTQEKIEIVRNVAADLRTKAMKAGFPEPFVSWVVDANGGSLILDAPAVSDTLACPPISWESKPILVIVFSTVRFNPLVVPVNFDADGA